MFLTGVVVVLALAVGAAVVAQTTGDDTGPRTDFVLDVSSTDVSLSHNGGDSLALADLTVILRGDGTEHRFTPDAGDVTGGDGRFGPGERLTLTHGFPPGDVTVHVVHGPSNTILSEDHARIPS